LSGNKLGFLPINIQRKNLELYINIFVIDLLKSQGCRITRFTRDPVKGLLLIKNQNATAFFIFYFHFGFEASFSLMKIKNP